MTISPTLAINQEIARRRAAGLATVALGFGEASVPVHPALVTQLRAHAHRGDYGPVAGDAVLREAVAGYWERRGLPTRPDDVVCAPGTKPLLYALFGALDGPVLLPRPSWVSYAAQHLLLGREVVQLATRPGAGGVPDPALVDETATRMRQAGRPAAAVLLTLPDNPTGTVASADLVEDLCAVADRHDLLVISDEIYRDLVHDGSAVPTPAAVLPARTVTTYGLSKSLAVGGWRMGFARFPQELAALRGRVLTAASEIWSAAPQPVQQAAAWAVQEPPELAEHVAASRVLHGKVARAVAEVFTGAGARVAAPRAAFYVYPDLEPRRDRLDARGIRTGDDLARALLEEHGVATLPGSAFGDSRDRLCLRIATSMIYGEDDEQRGRALMADDPTRLPWVADALAHLRSALEQLTAAG
ncbi:MAG: aminotransferase class I/II-fold pyridoxal phosphate-dependent enzyme [Nocardioides sp.]